MRNSVRRYDFDYDGMELVADGVYVEYSDYEQLRGNLSLAKEGLANYQQEVERLKADAKRYSWLRDWIIQGRPRAEIDPHGHVAVRTTAEWEALLDEAISRTADPTTPSQSDG